MNKVTLKPHQKTQLKKKVKIEGENKTYEEYFSLSRFNKSIDCILEDFSNAEFFDTHYFVRMYDLLPSFKVEKAAEGKNDEYGNRDSNFTIPKTVLPYIYNELIDYLNSPFIADLEAYAAKTIECLNDKDRSLINVINAKKQALVDTLEGKQQSYITDFKATDLHSLDTFEDCLAINANYTSRYQEIRGLKTKIEALEKDTEVIVKRIANRTISCFTDSEVKTKSYHFVTDEKLVIVTAKEVYDLLTQIGYIKDYYIKHLAKAIA